MAADKPQRIILVWVFYYFYVPLIVTETCRLRFETTGYDSYSIPSPSPHFQTDNFPSEPNYVGSRQPFVQR